MQPKRSTIILDLNICIMFWERLLETECNKRLSALKHLQNKRGGVGEVVKVVMVKRGGSSGGALGFCFGLRFRFRVFRFRV